MVFLKIFIMSSSNIQKTRGRVQWTPVCPSSPTSSQSIFLSPVPFPTCYGFFFFSFFFPFWLLPAPHCGNSSRFPKTSLNCSPGDVFQTFSMSSFWLTWISRHSWENTSFFFLNVKHIQFYLYSNNTIWEVWEALLLTLSVPNKTLKHSKMRSFEAYTIRPNSC